MQPSLSNKVQSNIMNSNVEPVSPCIVPVWSDSQILVWMIGEVCIEMLAGVSGVNISTARRGGGGEGGMTGPARQGRSASF